MASSDPSLTPLPSTFWNHRRVVVTGGAGFLGSRVTNRLRTLGAEVSVPRRREFDLRHEEDALRCLEGARAQIIIHSAATYGGLGLTMARPATIAHDNLLMGIHLLEAARRTGAEKVVVIGTACAYPDGLQVLREEDLWGGPLHESVVHYGLSKKALLVLGDAHRREHGLRSIHLIPCNLYGPGNTMNPERSHVAGALIRRFVGARQAGAPAVEVWGTGRALREFLYVEDAAEGILRAAERYDDPLPLNLGTGIGTPVLDLAELIRRLTGYAGRVEWNASKPDGQVRRLLDVTRMKRALGWEPCTPLEDGLRHTIEWYVANQAAADAAP